MLTVKKKTINAGEVQCPNTTLVDTPRVVIQFVMPGRFYVPKLNIDYTISLDNFGLVLIFKLSNLLNFKRMLQCLRLNAFTKIVFYFAKQIIFYT